MEPNKKYFRWSELTPEQKEIREKAKERFRKKKLEKKLNNNSKNKSKTKSIREIIANARPRKNGRFIETKGKIKA